MSDDRKLSDIGNELHNLSCHVVHHNEDWANQLGALAYELWNWNTRAQLPSQGGEAVGEVHPLSDGKQYAALYTMAGQHLVGEKLYTLPPALHDQEGT